MGCAVVAAALSIAAATATGAATPNEPSTLLPVLQVDFDDSFQPKVLSIERRTPIAIAISGKVGTEDGSQPPALSELAIQLDKSIAIDLKGYPICHGLFQQVEPPMTPQEECRGAFIGSGAAHFEIRLSEAEPIFVRSALQIFNVGFKGSVPMLVAVGYIQVPTPSRFVATIRIKKIHNGDYGSEMAITFPKIAGGSGSITSLDLRFKKQLPFEGERFSAITAKCPDGRLQFRDAATFFNYETGESLESSAEPRRTCTGR